MRAALSMFVGLAVVLALSLGLRAADDSEGKQVTLKGTITCAKCDLKLAKACHTVIKVEQDGKDEVYWFDTAGSKKNHKAICTEAKKGTVKGTVSEKDGKKIITVSSVKFDE